jgi:uncharacterized protein (TIGR02246 family)
MKSTLIYIICLAMYPSSSLAQGDQVGEKERHEIYDLVDKYTQSRENRDTVLLESILTSDIDQLVSSGEWREGKSESMKGMMRSSGNNPGKRKITIDKIRLITSESALADAKYEIQNSDGTSRKMRSTFVLVKQNGDWKITAIRNMLPAGQ